MLNIPSRPIINLSNNHYKSKKIHIIKNNGKTFTVQINKEDKQATTILSFARKIDAIKIGSMLENHYLLTKDWPETILNPNSGLFLISNDIVDNVNLMYLDISTWNFNDFNTYCMNNLIDYLYIHNITQVRNDAYSITGQLVRIADSQLIECADILNKIYDKS